MRLTMYYSTYITLILLATVDIAMSKFYNCKSGGYWTLRCCTYAQLPNGCECWGRNFYRFPLRKPYPVCPTEGHVQFFLYTNDKNVQFEVKSSGGNLTSSTYNPANPTKFIIHGFTDKGPNTWSTKMKNALLGVRNMNVIIVNWATGAKGPNYFQAAANTRVTGAMTARLIQELKKINGTSLRDIHIIGHSLGAHAAGVAGKEVHRLESARVGRITGLDPAGLTFENDIDSVKLKKTDATFVDVIHTDINPLLELGFGYRYSIGNVDFYPNTGKNQPGCRKSLGNFTDIGTISASVACSHMRVLDIFTDSISACKGMTQDPQTNCVMGYHANATLCNGDDKTVTTGSNSPFCAK